jgi:RNA polymerase sigma factor (sigma-70 family)
MKEKHGPSTQGRWFRTTHWTAVLSARDGQSPEAQAALDGLCRTYWPPLYSYIRQRGHSPHEAKDLTQEFFARFLEKEYLQHLKDRRGKFRSFLLTLVKHFLSDQFDRSRAQKRGGGRVGISLDEFSAEERLLIEPANSLTPEYEYDRRWAKILIENAYERLKKEYSENGNAGLFDRLKEISAGMPRSETYEQLGSQIGLSEAAVKSAVHRMRQRHREILREEIEKTVHTKADLEDEVRHFIHILSGK